MATIESQDFNALGGDTFTDDALGDGGALTNTAASATGGTGLATFETLWFDTRGNGTGPTTGGESGDFIGVNDFSGSNAPDVGADGSPVGGGEKNFEFNDGDGRLDLVFDTVATAGYADRTLGFDYWINDTGFESNDAFTVTLSDGTTSATVLDFGETELEASTSADDGTANWNSVSFDIEAAGLGPDLDLTISVDNNAGSENVFVDNIAFEGDAQGVAINEIVVSTAGTDREFVEFIGAPGTTLDGLSLLEVEPGGEIDTIIDLGGNALGANGYFLAASPEAESVLGVTGDLSIPDNTFTNGSRTYLLVEDFTGASGDDIDADDDGIIDTAPWSQIVDSVAPIENDTPLVYSSNVIGPDGSFLAPGGFRDPEETGAFRIHDFSDDSGYTPTPATTGGSGAGAIAAPYGFDFETPFADEGWQAVSVDGDTANTWGDASFGGDGFAEVNAFGGTAPADDWLISPLIDISGLTDPVASFANVKNFEDDGLADPEVTFQVSTDYDGAGDPSGASWTPIPYTFSGGGFSEADSGELDLSGIGGDEAYFAFRYQSSGNSGGSSALWQIDDFAVGEGSSADPVTERLISEIQGPGAASPLEGQQVTVTAVVTADFQDPADSDYGGFFLQEEDGDADSDPLTSEGIFVFEGNASVAVPDVEVGDVVTLTGTVDEFDGETQIDAISGITVDASGQSGLVTPAEVAFGADDGLVPDTTTNPDGHILGDYERYEGMLVTVPEELTVGDLFTLGRYNEVGLTAGGRIPTYTQTNAPSVSGFQQFQQDAARRGLVIDDAFEDEQNRDPIFPQNGGLDADVPRALRSGDTVENLTGVMAYREPVFDSFNYRLIPTEAPQFVSANPRPATAPDLGGDLTVASFNVLNYFTTIDTNVGGFNGPNITGPAGDQEPRGAESEPGVFTTDPDGLSELDRQQAKLVDAIAEIDADILGLVEIENDPASKATPAIETLVEAINAEFGSDIYDYIDTGPIEGAQGGAVEGDAIRVAFLYDQTSVSPAGDFALLDETVDTRFQTVETQRPALAQTFEEIESGARFTAAVNHFKSKGSVVDGDVATGDGQANNNTVRTEAAEALVDWLATDPTGSGDDDFMILGDINAYFMEDPIEAIRDGADDMRGTADDFVPLVGESEYSFGFPIGLDTVPQVQTFGLLDHALASTSLAEQVTGADVWNINADEPAVTDYNLNFKSGAQQQFLYAPDEFRSSDHDPVVVGLDLDAPDTGPNVIASERDGIETLRGTSDPETFLAAGRLETMFGNGGADTFDFTEFRDDPGRNTGRIRDWDGDDSIAGVTRDDVLFDFSFWDTTYLLLENDFDTIVVNGAESIDDVFPALLA